MLRVNQRLSFGGVEGEVTVVAPVVRASTVGWIQGQFFYGGFLYSISCYYDGERVSYFGLKSFSFFVTG